MTTITSTDRVSELRAMVQHLSHFCTPEDLDRVGLLADLPLAWDSQEWLHRIQANLPTLPPQHAVGDWVFSEHANKRIVAVYWDRSFMVNRWIYLVPGLGSLSFSRAIGDFPYQHHERIGGIGSHSWRATHWTVAP